MEKNLIVREMFMKKIIFFLIGLYALFGGVLRTYAQNLVPFGIRYQETLKGDMLQVGNSILIPTINLDANGNYVGTKETNGGIELKYTDVDEDPSTFSSSSANVTYKDTKGCVALKKAYLYWATTNHTSRSGDKRIDVDKVKDIKFKAPGGSYVQLEGQAVYDRGVYVYWAEVTDYITNKSNFAGTYTVADMQAPLGYGANGAGWSLFLVYEDTSLPSKHITLYDGYTNVYSGSKYTTQVSGFKTIPSGPVNATFAFAALEGELGLRGDALYINNAPIDASGRWSSQNPNFFNSTITDLNGVNLDRKPASTNLLGFDAGMVKIPNVNNSVIKNGATSATIFPTSASDVYYIYMMAFSVEVIEPKIIMEKRVYRNGTDVTGEGVNRGDILKYEIKFRNIGNDDARNLVIKDELPANVDFTNGASWSASDARITMTTDNNTNQAEARTVYFNIPDDLVQQKGAEHSVSFYVQVVADCNKYRDACSNVVKNIAYASYLGKENPTTTPFGGYSFSEFNSCDGGVEGESNVIVDMVGCTATQEVELCGASVTLEAGKGFDSYTWEGPNGLTATGQTLEVRDPGTYTVTKNYNGTDCVTGKEVFTVKLPDGSLDKSPFADNADQTFICANDGRAYPQFYLCGDNDKVEFNFNYNNATAYSWERKTDNCSVTVPATCPVYDESCWTVAYQGNNANNGGRYTITTAGEYRLKITLQNGCTSVYYFKVTKVGFAGRGTKVQDIECGTPGKVRMDNAPAGYEFALVKYGQEQTLLQGWQTSSEFSVSEEGLYIIKARQQGTVPAGEYRCEFLSDNISVSLKNPRITIAHKLDEACESSKGVVRVQVTDMTGPYNYVISSATGVVAEKRNQVDTDIYFDGLPAGTYTLTVSNNRNCNLTEKVTIGKVAELKATATVLKHLMCGTAVVRIDVTGGTKGDSYGYKLPSETSYRTNANNESFYEFNDITTAGVHTFEVIDQRGCTVTVQATVQELTPPSFDVEASLLDCGTKGKIEFKNVVNPEVYTLLYSIDGVTFQTAQTFDNLTVGQTYTPTLSYALGTYSCTMSQTLTINPSADGNITAGFVGVSELVGCGTGADTDKAKIRVTNVQGGTLPYEYSYDNKQTWVTEPEAWLLPGTDLPIFVRDAKGCEFAMKVTIEVAPVEPVFSHTINYNYCDGTADVTVNSNQSGYNYEYSVDGGASQPNPTLENLTPGTHTITVNYSLGNIANPQVLFLEDFGAGTENVTSPYASPVHYFEPQDQRTESRVYNAQGGNGRFNLNKQLDDGEYSVTQKIDRPHGTWRNPVDHTGLTNGRFMAFNVGNIAGQGGILYERKIKDILPNRDIVFSMYIYNFLRVGTNGADPNVSIQLINNSGTVLMDIASGAISKNISDTDWRLFSGRLNPGNNTELTVRLRTNSTATNGNDLAIDDIYLYQMPEICPDTYTLTVNVEAGKTFTVDDSTEVITPVSCVGASDGSYRIQVDNFDANYGYFYSTDGGTNWQHTTANPFVLNNLAKGQYTVHFAYDYTNPNCQVTRTFAISEPQEIVINEIRDNTFGSPFVMIAPNVYAHYSFFGFDCDNLLEQRSIIVLASGGTGTLSYAIGAGTPQTSNVLEINSSSFRDLYKASTHILTITDASGCEKRIELRFLDSSVDRVTQKMDFCENSGYYEVKVKMGEERGIVLGTKDDFKFRILKQTNTTVYEDVSPFEVIHTDNSPVTEIISGTDYIFKLKFEDFPGLSNYYGEVVHLALLFRGCHFAEVGGQFVVGPLETEFKQNVCYPNLSVDIKIVDAKGSSDLITSLTVDGVRQPNITFYNTTFSAGELQKEIEFVFEDANGCTHTFTKTFTTQGPVTLTLASQTDVKCYGENTGSFAVTASGGTGTGYKYILNGTEYVDNEFYNLPAGTYQLVVTDSDNCSSAALNVTITQPSAPLQVGTELVSLISCSTDNTAEVKINVQGGTAPYTDNLTGGTTAYAGERTVKLRPGTHTLRITDANGCTTSATVVVPERPTPPTVSLGAGGQVTYDCKGKGIFTVVPSNGTAFTYEYSLDGTTWTSNASFKDIAPGNYEVKIRYKEADVSIDCGYTITLPVEVLPGKEFQNGTPQLTHVTCFDGNNGAVTVPVANFDTTTGYRYQLSGPSALPQSTSTNASLSLPNLKAGNYTLTLTYPTTNGCTLTVPFTITQPDKLTATASVTTVAKCNNNGATISVTASGGVPPYNYILYKEDGTTIERAFQANRLFENIPVGKYKIVVRDANGCLSDVVATPAEVVAPRTVSFTATTADCFAGGNTGVIEVNVTDGNGGYMFSINNGVWQTPTPASATTFTFTGLSARAHIIRVRDAYGCQSSSTLTIYPALTVVNRPVSVSCNSGSITVTASGGTGNYQYAFVNSGQAVTDTDYRASNTYSVATAGTYDVYVKSGSCVKSETVTVAQAPAVGVTSTPENPTCHGGKGAIALTMTGDAPYTIALALQTTPATVPTSVSNLVNNTYRFNELQPGTYSITVTDRYGCKTSTTATITELPQITVSYTPIAPVGCITASTPKTDIGVRIDVVTATVQSYTAAGYEIHYSVDNGRTWQASHTFTGYMPGEMVYPVVKTVASGAGANATAVCLERFDPYRIPYSLEELTVSTNLPTATEQCKPAGFEVRVTAEGGTPGYQFTMDDPQTTTPVWHNATEKYPATATVTDNNSYVFSGLIPGAPYRFFVKDANGCIRENSRDIYEGYVPPVNFTADVKPACNGQTTGDITFNITPATTYVGNLAGTFTWTVYEVNGTRTPTATGHKGTATMPTKGNTVTVTANGLAINKTYYIVIEATGGCKFASKDFLVYEQAALSATAKELRKVACDPAGLVQIENATGGGGIYEYQLTSTAFVNPISWTSSSTIEIPMSNISAGTTLGSTIQVDIEMRDQYGCTFNLTPVNVSVVDKPTFTAVANSCDENLSITITPTQKNATDYVYSIDGGTTWLDNGGIFNGLTAGNYTPTVKDKETGCVGTSTTASTSLVLHPKMKAEVKQTKLLECTAGNNAEIKIEVTEGSGTYEYEVQGGSSNISRTSMTGNTITLSAATAGTYRVTVYDALGCTTTGQTFTIEVVPPVQPQFSLMGVEPSCYDGNDGSIKVQEVDLGLGTITYAINLSGVTYSATTSSFEGLKQGSYVITATAPNGCTHQETINLGQPTAITRSGASVYSVKEFGCTSANTNNNAEISVDLTQVSGGTPPYTYEIKFNNGTTVLSSRDASLSVSDTNGGAFSVTITDANGCTLVENGNITPYDELKTLSVTITDLITCLAGENVTLAVTSHTNNAGKWEFAKAETIANATWQSSNSFTNLPVGWHTFWVRHTETGCVLSVAHEVKEPNTFSVSNPAVTKPVPCKGEDATLTFTITNTNANYTTQYSYVVKSNGVTVNSAQGTRNGNGDISVNLKAGTYVLEVTQVDNPKCTQTVSFSVDEPSASLTATTQITPITCASNTNGVIEVINVSGGWGTYSYYVGTNASPAVTDYVNTPRFANLGAGTYKVFVRDVNGCVVQLPDATLQIPAAITATLNVTTQNCTAGTGVIEVQNTAGGRGSGYVYQLIRNGADYGSPQASNIFRNLPEGAYTVRISDAWTCSATITTAVNLYKPITPTSPRVVINKELTCTNPQAAQVEIQPNGGSPNIKYVVKNPDGTKVEQTANGVFTLSQIGNYEVEIYDVDTACATVTTSFTLEATIPVTFTYTQENVKCNGGNDGSIRVTLPATNTQLPYTVTLESTLTGFVTQEQVIANSLSDKIFSNLKAGNYTVKVTSARGCTHSEQVQITEPDVLTINSTLTQATPFACNASNIPQASVLTAVAQGGTAPYYYSIDNVSFVNTTGRFIIYDTGVTQSITVYVKDSNGCVTDNSTTPIVINTLPKITGFTASQRTAATCRNAETVELTIAGGGNRGFDIEVSTTANLSAPIAKKTVTGNTTTYDLTQPGQYTFKLTDLETHCSTSTTYMLNAYNTIEAVGTMSSSVSCADASDGTITLNVTGYTGAYTYQVLNATTGVATLQGSGNTTASTLIAGVSVGSWKVKVTATDSPYCETETGVVYVQGPTLPLTVVPTLVNVLSCDGNDAVISALASGGWDDYQYRLLLNGTAHPVYGTFTTTTRFEGLDVGSYEVEVTDAKGCVVKSVALSVVAPTPIVATLNPINTSLNCFGDQTASIEATSVSGGNGVYQYSLVMKTSSGTTVSVPQANPRFDNLGAGEYAIKVIDGWNCSVTTTFVTVTEPSKVQVTAEITNGLTCTNGGATVVLTAVGGSGSGYEFATSQTGPFSSNSTFTLPVGIYTFYAKDSNGCLSDVSNTIEIEAIMPLSMVVDQTSAYVTCYGESTAVIRAMASGGLGSYQYELLDASQSPLSPPITNNDGNFTDIPAGSYTVKVTSVDCEYVEPTAIVVNEGQPLVIQTQTSTNVTCNGRNDGTITVNVTGGSGNIQYAISPYLNRFESINEFDNLEPGSYTVIAQDDKGCYISMDFVITEPPVLTITASNVTHETCLGNADGTVTVNVTGGTPPYYTSLNDGSPSADWQENKFFYDNLPAQAGNVIIVKDANGCEEYVVLGTVNPGIDIQASVSVTYTCPNNASVQNVVQVSVNPSYSSQVTYSLDGANPTSNPSFTNVVAGNHTITVSHIGGCTIDLPIRVEGYTPLSYTWDKSDVTCYGAANGSYNIYVTGGSGNYEYAISPNLTRFDTSNSFRNLDGGTYTVVVQDIVVGCRLEISFSIAEPTPLVLNNLNIIDESCYQANDGSITFEISGSIPTYEYALVNSNGVTVSARNGITATTPQSITGLLPDVYTLNFSDVTGVCSGTQTIQIVAAPNLEPAQVNLVYECATVSGTAPTNYLEVVFTDARLTYTNTTYALNSTNSSDAVPFTEFIGTNGIIRDLPAGNGQFITIFHNGCQTTIPTAQYFDVVSYNPLTLLDVSEANVVNQIKVEAQGGKGPYTYYFNGKNIDTNEYFVTRSDKGYVDANGKLIKQIDVVAEDSMGCQVTLSFEKEFIDIYIPDNFTPNNDGINDTWGPTNVRPYPNMEVQVYDRYGRLIATLRRGQTWDGRYNSSHLPAGDYWYIIRLNEDEDDSREFVGHFTLYR